MKSEQEQKYSVLFGKFIRGAREARNLNQEDVAQAVGISRSYLSTLESGKRNVDLSLALSLCDALKVNLNDFIQNYKI